MIWWAIIAASLACYGLKLAGLSIPDRALEHPLTVRVAALIPVGLLGALIAVQVFGDGQSLVLDARVVGLGVAVLLLVVRAPFLVVVGAAALAAALVRLL
ncbi:MULTISPECIES: AzlD domain-containing protein [Mumia]|uniref:AzlD domain-containing protein n=1 Tax=Mumia TaxID=1546255 RepID=UPI00142044D8|nr:MULTISPECIES: AzlD domain-containing protein [unclassified Mumia]QMW64999.1 AzlD domain-containing protein [Mumia sp. ZJ1417]